MKQLEHVFLFAALAVCAVLFALAVNDKPTRSRLQTVEVRDVPENPANRQEGYRPATVIVPTFSTFQVK
jgi:hypothetical protein